MNVVMEETHVQNGQLVAIEGPPEVVSMQLRLLPKTSSFHVIPSIETYLNERKTHEGAFDVRRYILHVHGALEVRYKEAMGFLCKPGHHRFKRIVFLNGGICSAHALCISAIRHNLTNGNLSRAGILFDQVVRGGMEGVMGGVSPSSPRPPTSVRYMYEQVLGDVCGEEEIDGSDPITRAMKRAEALYERTASLDLSDLTIPEEATAVEMPVVVPTTRTSRALHISRSSYLSQISSTLQTPDTGNVEYGEARIVQVQPAVPTTLKRVKSADRWYTRAERKSVYAPLTPPRSYSTRTARKNDKVAPEASTLSFLDPPLSLRDDAARAPQTQEASQLAPTLYPRLHISPSAPQVHETLRALHGHAPPKAPQQIMQNQEDLIISLTDANADPVMQFATENLVYDGLPIHFCSPHHSTRAVPHDDGKASANRQMAVETQNALRALLAEVLPASSDYDDLLFAEVRSTERLWEETSDKTKPAYDLILALGVQDAVPKQLYQRIAGELEILGQRREESRSRRVEFGQLIASAMQSYTSQPLASQTRTNPFADPFLLAHLLVTEMKHILTASPEARYIILDFTPQHLPIVFAMQSMIGPETFKIASIVNDEELIQGFRKRRTRNRAHHLASAPESLPFPPVSPSPPPPTSFAEADFIISSSAGEAEEAIFINAIWKHLIQVDDFYAPRPDSPEFDDAHLLPGPSSSNSPRNVRFHVPFVDSPDSPPDSPPGRADHRQVAAPPSPRYTVFPPPHQHQATRPVSPVPTIASRGSSRSKTNRSFNMSRPGRVGGVVGSGMKRSLSKLFSRKATTRGPVLPPVGFIELETENYVGFAAQEEEDDDDDETDADERRLVPLFDGRRVHDSGASTKALRMLGISLDGGGVAPAHRRV
jgi:hypothetical protein